MKIQYASDLHLEFPENRKFLSENNIIQNGDILILAGDIILDKTRKNAEKFFEDWTKQFKFVIYIPGNHEFYSGEVLYSYPNYYKEISNNFYKLNNKTIEIENIRFICSTLWTNIPIKLKNDFESESNDYKLIQYSKKQIEKRLITIEDTNLFHDISVKFIESELAKPFQGKTILVTHQLPSFDLILDSDNNELIKHYCATNLENIYANHKIDFWIFGHYHRTVNKKMFNTTFVSNPLGYMSEDQKNFFSQSITIEV
ncbi:metallophosphoesterase [Leptospira bandrabouensis]|uniref:metallophosphoesterase n=1 Tax=Leptospira bandrabouensis TaxID=2484903 RepID=UPI00223D11A0|nr:metallophosphoesterase [Leptospira bandrabouensis]MCW7478343.1 metallophosphoesterase [Leptospira bandrabouensis]MCW7485535.1 metallophosphoesterase [Leptospira bandrabouensis]